MKKEADDKSKKLSRSERDRQYLYKQLADIIKQEISDGKYKPGDRLLSMDNLAADYSVNKVTVRRALAELNKMGLIYSIPAQGTYISEPDDEPKRSTPNTFITIGLFAPIMVPGNTGQYHLDMIEGLREELEKNNANLVILPAKFVQPNKRTMEMLTKSNLDGIVLIGHFEPLLLRRVLSLEMPAVLVDHSLRGASVDTILVDNRDGGYQAMDHLIGLGHRKLACITGPIDHVVTKERLAGAQEAMETAGLSPNDLQVIESTFIREGGYDAMLSLLQSENCPTGIFSMNDEMASGAIQAINAESKLKVPEDISIIGFDNIALAQATQPPLSTVDVPKGLMGRIAVQRLLEQLENRTLDATTTMVPTQIVPRESTIMCLKT